MILAAMELCLALGVRGCFAYHGVSMGDFASFDDFADDVATQPSSARLRASPFLVLMINSTNALCCGASSLFLGTLVILTLAFRFGETRGVRFAMLALIMLGAAIWFGLEQSIALDV